MWVPVSCRIPPTSLSLSITSNLPTQGYQKKLFLAPSEKIKKKLFSFAADIGIK
jgi:hypothetical protein